MANKIYVIIPAKNEEKHVQEVILKTKKYAKNIVLIDDGSCDKTSLIAKKSGAIVLRHAINLGKGAALKTGCEYALMQKAEIIIFMDSDGQHDPHDIPRFLSELKKYDIVFGSRRLNKNMPFILRFGNWFINKVSEILFGIYVSDTQSGYRAFKANVYEKIKWKSKGYSVESEIIAKTGKYNLKFKEIIIDTIYNDNYKGTSVLDGINIVVKMFMIKLKG
jgi:UDP-N-acetylglucosamine---dolichyl-phosphate N-acetylglucosaminyltransferase